MFDDFDFVRSHSVRAPKENNLGTDGWGIDPPVQFVHSHEYRNGREWSGMPGTDRIPNGESQCQHCIGRTRNNS
jgi:hypothetical protein